MDYLDKPDPQTFIAHHGIKGQKWGVRRFQNADGSLTKAGKERYNEQNSPNSSDNSENQKFHLTEKQKKYCKTIAIATGVALVTYAGFKLADSGELNRLVEKAKEVSLGSHYQGFSKNEDYSGPLSVESIKDGLLNKINPNFSSTFSLGSVGSYNNCKRCTFAYELSRRGYDVRATQTIAGTGQNLNGNNMMLFVPRCSRKDYKQALKTWKNDPSIYATNNLIKKLSGAYLRIFGSLGILKTNLSPFTILLKKCLIEQEVNFQLLGLIDPVVIVLLGKLLIISQSYLTVRLDAFMILR